MEGPSGSSCVKDKRYPINEIFGPTIQGEGPLLGTPSVFLRTQGCDNSCVWCDTPYALKGPCRHMTAMEILTELQLKAEGCKWVTITGGNPLIHDLFELIRPLHGLGFLVGVETQGTVFREWVRDCDSIVLSPKPPSSGNATDSFVVQRFVSQLHRTGLSIKPWSLKVVVFDDIDYAYAKQLHSLFPFNLLHLQVGNNIPLDAVMDYPAYISRLRWLAEKVLADHQKDGFFWHDVDQGVKVLPQLHLLLYGPKRGV